MSIVDEDYEVSICANCGRGEEESHKLKACTACKMVKYCNRECQIAHRPQHKKECKKRAAELHDEELFKQPPPKEDCPICFQQLPRQHTGWGYQTCCGKVICSGCIHAPVYDNQGNVIAERKCPFCKTPIPSTYEEAMEREKERVEAGDPNAICNHGHYYSEGERGLPQDYRKALELWHRAAELGDADAYANIGYAYENGDGVERDMKKANYYYELSAMRGNATARYKLGLDELQASNDRALKHLLIAIRGGCNDSVELIKDLYSNGHASKEDYTKALQSYQEYLGEIKSPQRDKAASFSDEYRYY